MSKKAKKQQKQPDTYNRAMSHLMSRLLFTYAKKERFLHDPKDGFWEMALMKPVPEGALVVPFAITDAKEWWLGWYRGTDEEGYQLVESVQTHKICRFGNTGFLFLNNLEFAQNPLYQYTDKQYEAIDRLKIRVAKNNNWNVVGNPTFHDDGSIELPIRRKFCDKWLVKTYRNFKACTIEALDKHCSECPGKEND